MAVRRFRRRAEMRLTAQELADTLGINPSTLWRWEHGLASPSGVMAQKWDEALDAFAAQMRALTLRHRGDF